MKSYTNICIQCIYQSCMDNSGCTITHHLIKNMKLVVNIKRKMNRKITTTNSFQQDNQFFFRKHKGNFLSQSFPLYYNAWISLYRNYASISLNRRRTFTFSLKFYLVCQTQHYMFSKHLQILIGLSFELRARTPY